MSLKVIIVDDEPLARERLRTFLEKEEEVEILAECPNGTDAVEAVKTLHPDLLFLDVQMPEMDGFEVLQALGGEPLPEVVFVTAYDQYALKAFEVHALDYLLKPFKQSRFKEALDNARARIRTRQTGVDTNKLLELLSERKPHRLTRLSVRNNDRIAFVKTSQIDWIESAGNYVVAHTGNETHVLRETLTALESGLAPDRFIRVSRSAIVNMESIKELQPMFNGEHVVILKNGTQIPMTRGLRKVEELLKFS